MGTVWKILKRVGIVAGPIMFFTSVALAAQDIAGLGLSWYWWAAIGGGIFFVSGFAIIWSLNTENKRLRRKNQELERGESQLGMNVLGIGLVESFLRDTPLRVDVIFRATKRIQIDRLEVRIDDRGFEPVEKAPYTALHTSEPPLLTKLPIVIDSDKKYRVWFGIPEETAKGKQTGHLWVLAGSREWLSNDFIISFGTFDTT